MLCLKCWTDRSAKLVQRDGDRLRCRICDEYLNWEIAFDFPYDYHNWTRQVRRALKIRLAARYNGKPLTKPSEITWEVWSWNVERLCHELRVTVRADEATGRVIIEKTHGD